MSDFIFISVIAQWVLIIINLVLMLVLIKVTTDFLKNLRLSGKRLEKSSLLVGQRAPIIEGIDSGGTTIMVPAEKSNYLLVFTNDNCATCQEIMPRLHTLLIHKNLKIIVIGPQIKDNHDNINVPDGVLFIRSSSAFDDYQIKQVPYFAIITREGYVADLGIVPNIHVLEVQLKEFFEKY